VPAEILPVEETTAVDERLIKVAVVKSTKAARQ
jgi:hypothetical protein